MLALSIPHGSKLTRLTFNNYSELHTQLKPNQSNGVLDLRDSTYAELTGRDDRHFTEYHYADHAFIAANTECNKASDFLHALQTSQSVTSVIFPEIAVDSDIGLTLIANAFAKLMGENSTLKSVALKASYCEGNIYRTLTIKLEADHINVYYGTHDNVPDMGFDEPAEQLQTSYHRAGHRYPLRGLTRAGEDSPFNPISAASITAPQATPARAPRKP